MLLKLSRKSSLRINDVYSTVHSNIIQEESFPKVKKVFSYICKEEQHRQLSCAAATVETGGTMKGGAFAAFKSLAAIGVSNITAQKLVCGRCLKIGHGTLQKIAYFPIAVRTVI